MDKRRRGEIYDEGREVRGHSGEGSVREEMTVTKKSSLKIYDTAHKDITISQESQNTTGQTPVDLY